MRRFVVAALTAGLLAGVAGGLPEGQGLTRLTDSQVAGHTKASEGPCDEIRWQRGTGAVRALIECVWDRFRPRVGPSDGGAGKAITVATCESGLRPRAVGGSNLGLFQHRSRYWPGRFANLIQHFPLRRSWELSSSALDARTNAIVTVLYVRRYGWGAWSCA